MKQPLPIRTSDEEADEEGEHEPDHGDDEGELEDPHAETVCGIWARWNAPLAARKLLRAVVARLLSRKP